jgi:N-formylglutamate amidohydrolase
VQERKQEIMLPFIISIPHCSAQIPEAVRGALALNEQQIIESVDFGSEEVFGGLSSRHVIKAQWSRLIVDLNRAPDQTDPKGVIALTDYHGREVFQPGRNPDHENIIARVAQYHRPYHEKLESALSDAGVIGLIDGHSLNGTGPVDAPDPGQQRKDITISNNGDANGAPRTGRAPTSCTIERIQQFKQAFQDQGFSVALNAPYLGGYITHHYGRQLIKQGRFAIQIELNQDLYMRPKSLAPDPHLASSVAQQVMLALEKCVDSLNKMTTSTKT